MQFIDLAKKSNPVILLGWRRIITKSNIVIWSLIWSFILKIQSNHNYTPDQLSVALIVWEYNNLNLGRTLLGKSGSLINNSLKLGLS